ncbi:hypothetical protein MAR_022763 [Mya arenaria]|uniref:Uncharacterized protein n=1 Tax=Mya arenaria TaxID=6604 RepID=A0ABY7DTV9_MYAAR|nr:hypothetical protein MAR_022763 [Mya arenaria]
MIVEMSSVVIYLYVMQLRKNSTCQFRLVIKCYAVIVCVRCIYGKYMQPKSRNQSTQEMSFRILKYNRSRVLVNLHEHVKTSKTTRSTVLTTKIGCTIIHGSHQSDERHPYTGKDFDKGRNFNLRNVQQRGSYLHPHTLTAVIIEQVDTVSLALNSYVPITPTLLKHYDFSLVI